MNKHRNNPLIRMPLCLIMLLTTLIAASARAQTPAAANDYRDHTNRAARDRAGFRLFVFFAPDRPAKRTGFQVMPLSLNAKGRQSLICPSALCSLTRITQERAFSSHAP